MKQRSKAQTRFKPPTPIARALCGHKDQFDLSSANNPDIQSQHYIVSPSPTSPIRAAASVKGRGRSAGEEEANLVAKGKAATQQDSRLGSWGPRTQKHFTKGRPPFD